MGLFLRQCVLICWRSLFFGSYNLWFTGIWDIPILRILQFVVHYILPYLVRGRTKGLEDYSFLRKE